jgi:YcaO-like protein with predicted kinase domain
MANDMSHRPDGALVSPRHRRAFRGAGVAALLDAGPCDRLGVPVGLAIRPNGRVARLFDGKGLTPAAAMVAAGMEAVETARAESPDLPLRAASADEFPERTLLRPDQLPALADFKLDPTRVTLWCAGRGLLTGTRRWAPIELVGIGCRIPVRHRLGLPATSNGLAAGETQAQATLAASLEAIERDQLARWLDRAELEAARVRFVCQRHDASLHDVIKRCRLARLLPVLWRIDDDLGIPSALCQLFDLGADRRRPWAMTSGSATHPQALVAARQAILEAIQVRVAMRLRHPVDWPVPRSRVARGEMIAREMEMALKAPSAAPVRNAIGVRGVHPATVVRSLARTIMRRRGVEPVVFRLSARDSFPAVVRVIVPGFRDPYR